MLSRGSLARFAVVPGFSPGPDNPKWARQGEIDTILPTGRKSEKILLGYGCHHARGLNGGLRPGGIAHQRQQGSGPTYESRDGGSMTGGRQGLTA